MSAISRQLTSTQRAADRWFREQGLPTFVPLRRWFTDLPRRVAPLVVWVAFVGFFLKGFVALFGAVLEAAGPNELDGDLIVAIVVLVTVLMGVVTAWAFYLLARLLLRHLPVVAGTVVATVLVVLSAVWMIADGYEFEPGATAAPVFKTVGIIALCVLVTGMGGGALISWASRLAVQNVAAIGSMASIALPVIFMLVVFTLFSNEVWQMASALSWGSIGLAGLVVAVLAVFVVLRVSASDIDDGSQEPTDEQRAALLVGTPADGRDASAAPRQRLRAPQRVNILLAMTFAQLVQALFFAALLNVLLIVIGGITVPVGIVELWVGAGNATQPLAVEHLRIGDTTLPLTVNLLKATTLLSLIATLPFVLSAASEVRYRERFFDPIMANMRRAIVVRDVFDASR